MPYPVINLDSDRKNKNWMKRKRVKNQLTKAMVARFVKHGNHDQSTHERRDSGAAKASRDKTAEFAESYVEPHDKASKEFNAAFKKAGAKM